MEGGLTFTIGKGFGQMLQRIAWEKLTEKYNPREAVEIITKSLPGCTEGMAVDILDGKIILGEDEATQEVTGTPGAGGKFNDWILFSGSFYGKTLTEAQIEKLYRYGQVCHRGVLRLGTAQTQITAARLRETEPLMLNKLLN